MMKEVFLKWFVRWTICKSLEVALIAGFLGLFLLRALYSESQNLHLEKNIRQNNVSEDFLIKILAEGEHDNYERLRRVQEVCQKYNLGLYKNSENPSVFKYPPTPLYSVFFFNRADHLAFCPLYKAASTTWLYNLSILGGAKEKELKSGKEQMSSVARRYFPEIDGPDAEQALLTSRRLLSVRHPFDRLISAFRDKLENRNRDPSSGTLHYYKRWGSKIRMKFREFGKLEPSFEEFVRYLIQTDLLKYADDHWIPYNLYCTPCLMRYDYIAKVETLTRDQLFFIHSLGFSDLLSAVKRHAIGQTNHITSHYFSQLSRNQVEALYNKYRLDFEMFDYSHEEYLALAKS